MAQGPNPFGQKTATAPAMKPPVAPPAAPAAAPVVAPTPPVMGEAAAPVVDASAPLTKGGKERKLTKKGNLRATPNTQATKEQRQFVINNYASMDKSSIARATGLTGQQVYRTVYEARQALDEKIKVATEAGDTATAAKLTEFRDSKLPHKEFGGGRTAGGENKKKAVVDALDELLGF